MCLEMDAEFFVPSTSVFMALMNICRYKKIKVFFVIDTAPLVCTVLSLYKCSITEVLDTTKKICLKKTFLKTS